MPGIPLPGGAATFGSRQGLATHNRPCAFGSENWPDGHRRVWPQQVYLFRPVPTRHSPASSNRWPAALGVRDARLSFPPSWGWV